MIKLIIRNGRMKITVKWLAKEKACLGGIEWFKNQTETDGLDVVKKLISEDKLDWANWLIVRIMRYKQYVSYGVYAAEQVIDIYEKQYPGDNRPRNAIDAAKKCIKNKSEKNISAAESAWSAAWSAAESAAWSARSARSAAESAAWSAWSVASAAESAAWSARSARSAAESAWSAAESAAWKIKILNYGIKLLEGK